MVINLHSGREHPTRDETVLYPLHGNILFSTNGWSLVQVFDNNILKLFQIRVGGVLEFWHSFHTSGAHRHDDTWDKSTPITGFFIPNARSTLVKVSHTISPRSALQRENKGLPFCLSLAGESIPVLTLAPTCQRTVLTLRCST